MARKQFDPYTLRWRARFIRRSNNDVCQFAEDKAASALGAVALCLDDEASALTETPKAARKR